MTDNNHEWAMNSQATPNDRQIRSSNLDKELDHRFETWWHGEGSGMSPRGDEDCEELVHRVSRIAWHNGAYCALNDHLHECVFDEYRYAKGNIETLKLAMRQQEQDDT